MVENAYKVTLAMAFVPLAFGLYWRRATTQGALASIILGLVVWTGLEIIDPEFVVAPHFAGMLVGTVAMVVGSLMPQTIPDVRSGSHHLHERVLTFGLEC